MAQPIFLELRVYQLAERLADAVHGFVSKWKPFHRGTVGVRLVQAADAIGAGIAHGFGRGMPRESRNAIRASLYETLYWLRRAGKRHLLTPEEIAELKPLMDEIGPRVKAFLKRFAQRDNTPRP